VDTDPTSGPIVIQSTHSNGPHVATAQTASSVRCTGSSCRMSHTDCVLLLECTATVGLKGPFSWEGADEHF
jgi:hypothetical protein